MERARAHEAIAQTLNEVGFERLGWTPEIVAETEQRIAIDDADIWDSSAHLVEFALRVLDTLELIEPYEGPGAYHPSRE
jgi:hypothetical protein